MKYGLVPIEQNTGGYGKIKVKWEKRPIHNLTREQELELQKEFIKNKGITKLPPRTRYHKPKIS